MGEGSHTQPNEGLRDNSIHPSLMGKMWPVSQGPLHSFTLESGQGPGSCVLFLYPG